MNNVNTKLNILLGTGKCLNDHWRVSVFCRTIKNVIDV